MYTMERVSSPDHIINQMTPVSGCLSYTVDLSPNKKLSEHFWSRCEVECGRETRYDRSLLAVVQARVSVEPE